jgi:transcriptional regulator with XRE-family HTH domain
MDTKKTKQIREEFKQLESPNARLIDKQMEISSQISRYLRQQGLTQKELAQKAGIGESQLSEIVRGEGNPTLKTLVKIEEALGQDIIVAPSFHEEEMKRKGFASLSPRRRAIFQIREIVSRTKVKAGESWQIDRDAEPSRNEIQSEIEVYTGEIDEGKLVPSYS